MSALTDTLLTRFAETPLRIGTRTSTMAMGQAERVAALIREQAPGIEVELVPIRVTADIWAGELAQLGGKGAFSREIDHALTVGGVDISVHCMKDVPGDVPLAAGTAMGAYLPREDVRDVVVTRDGQPLATLLAGSLIGTGAVRRRAQLGISRPDLRVEFMRGNVDTRLGKLDEGKYAALILARAGLDRLGVDRPHEVLPVEFHTAEEGIVSMVPAVGAGAIGIQARESDTPVMQLLDVLNHRPTARDILAERTMLHMLRGHCNSPIAGHATLTPDGQLALYGMVFNRDGSKFVRSHAWGDPADPPTLGAHVASDLLRQGARNLITATKK